MKSQELKKSINTENWVVCAINQLFSKCFHTRTEFSKHQGSYCKILFFVMGLFCNHYSIGPKINQYWYL